MERTAIKAPRRFLAATDGSEGAARAVAAAAEFARAAGGHLSIVTVSTGALSDAEAPYTESIRITEGDALEAISHSILAHAADTARVHGVKAIETSVRVGDPAEQIIESARRGEADVLVVGRRGRGRLEGLILGSVSQKLAALAPCIVVIVP